MLDDSDCLFKQNAIPWGQLGATMTNGTRGIVRSRWPMYKIQYSFDHSKPLIYGSQIQRFSTVSRNAFFFSFQSNGLMILDV